MRAAYTNRFYPPVLDLERVLYTTALSEEDYSCEADFDDRLQRAIGLARQKRHAEARFHLSSAEVPRGCSSDHIYGLLETGHALLLPVQAASIRNLKSQLTIS